MTELKYGHRLSHAISMKASGCEHTAEEMTAYGCVICGGWLKDVGERRFLDTCSKACWGKLRVMLIDEERRGE